jgi:hypothetical protein
VKAVRALLALVAGLPGLAAGQTIECASACTVTVVHELSFPFFELTLEEGGQIAGAVVLVWVVGWAFRMFIQTVRQTGQVPGDGSDGS